MIFGQISFLFIATDENLFFEEDENHERCWVYSNSHESTVMVSVDNAFAR